MNNPYYQYLLSFLETKKDINENTDNTEKHITQDRDQYTRPLIKIPDQNLEQTVQEKTLLFAPSPNTKSINVKSKHFNKSVVQKNPKRVHVNIEKSKIKTSQNKVKVIKKAPIHSKSLLKKYPALSKIQK